MRRYVNCWRAVAMSVPLVAGLAACSHGTEALQGDTRTGIAAKLVPGSTTEAEIRAFYGAPARQSSVNGKSTWQYGLNANQPHAENFIPIVNFFASGGSSSSKSLFVTFGPDEKLVDYAFTETRRNATSGIGQ